LGFGNSQQIGQGRIAGAIHPSPLLGNTVGVEGTTAGAGTPVGVTGEMAGQPQMRNRRCRQGFVHGTLYGTHGEHGRRGASTGSAELTRRRGDVEDVKEAEEAEDAKTQRRADAEERR
jgi:hypothetical protein